MRARWAILALVLVTGAFACTLNPQPYPPGQPDGSTGSFDAGASDAATAFGDGGAGNDTGAPPAVDAATEAGADAEGVDAEADAGDAEADADDAAIDARDDVTSDATAD